MRKLSLTATAALIMAVSATAPLKAQDANAIVSGIPGNVTEVTTGGAWSKADKNGTFRAIVVMTADKQPQVNVFVQLLTFEKDSTIANVVKTTPIKEVRDKKLQNAFVNFDAENEGKATLIITSYDAEKDADNSLYAEINADGDYKIIDAPKDDTDTAAQKKQ